MKPLPFVDRFLIRHWVPATTEGLRIITIDRGSMKALPSSGERIAIDASRRVSLLAATLCIRDGLWLVPRIS